jgi:GDP/UDP-N,N'-diacetylbacillosamine 2-epimerase (hydrolysing)
MDTGKRKVLAVTGARSEYDLMSSVYRRLQNDAAFDFRIVVTGPHLSEKYGLTAENISEDGFPIEARLYNLVDSDKRMGRVISIGNQIPLLAHTFDRVRPDLVLVAGDREESISTAMSCAFLDIPVAHFFGGDIAKDGNIDNSTRYATSKFSHLHFVTLERHKENLIRMGEDSWRIHVVGNPAIERFLETPDLSKTELARHFDLPNLHQYCVLIQHPIISEVEKQKWQIQETLKAISASGILCFINYPNSDAGNHEIIEAYKSIVAQHPDKFVLFKNLDRLRYVNLLRHANFMLGNSSSGLLEAPSIGLPAINIGKRQRGRVHGDNMIFVDHNNDQITQAIHRAMTDESFIAKARSGSNPYGDGNSSAKVIDVLRTVDLFNHTLIYKNITY